MVIFMPDELRWDCVGYTGNNVIQTPNVDRLAGAELGHGAQWPLHPLSGARG